MREVNVTELRNHLHQYLTSARRGVPMIVTWHGEAIARILPPEDKKKEALAQLKALQRYCKMTEVF